MIMSMFSPILVMTVVIDFSWQRMLVKTMVDEDENDDDDNNTDENGNDEEKHGDTSYPWTYDSMCC